MIKILHGENTVASRQALNETVETGKAKGLEITKLPALVDLAAVKNALQSGSLLGTNRLVVIENLFSRPKSREKEKIINFLNREKFDNELILWEEKEVKKVPVENAQVQLFKLDPIIFKFVESLRPGNQVETLKFLAELKKTEPAEIVFQMIIRQLRHLLMAKGGVLILPDWQKRRVESQAAHFSEKQLVGLMNQLLETDYRQKTSRDPYSLYSRLDLFLATL